MSNRVIVTSLTLTPEPDRDRCGYRIWLADHDIGLIVEGMSLGALSRRQTLSLSADGTVLEKNRGPKRQCTAVSGLHLLHRRGRFCSVSGET